jgi:DNA polymerase (family X)
VPPKGNHATDLVSTLQTLAYLSEIRGPADVAVRLRHSITAIAALNRTDQTSLLESARREAPGDRAIGDPLQAKLHEIVIKGGPVAVRTALTGVPWLIRRLIETKALTPEAAVTLVRKLDVVTLQNLEAALDDGRISLLPSPPAAGRLASSALALHHEAPQIPLGRALDVIDALLADISRVRAGLIDAVCAGDARRFEPLVRDLVIVAAAQDTAAAIDAICAMPTVAGVLHQSERRAIVHYQHLEIDLRVVTPEEYGTTLLYATGSRTHVKLVAARRGLARTVYAREADVYRGVGLQWIPAEMRHATGEIEAAAQGTLPSVVERSQIRGDLHMHSTYSDGRDTLEEMVAACNALGYEYIAITDHSQGAAASRTVAIDELSRQRDEIAQLREQFPHISILHGIEVDILLDGSLDFPDHVLERLDIVLASMHESGRQNPRTLTRRCIQAIRHPLVNVITHPANRLVGRTTGYALDFNAIYAAARDTGTALEIDGAPTHLDMDGEHARAAVAAGVTVTVDSDCHSARSLDRQMEMALGTARRGWVERRHVLNARPLAEVRAFVAAKRSGAS